MKLEEIHKDINAVRDQMMPTINDWRLDDLCHELLMKWGASETEAEWFAIGYLTAQRKDEM